MVDDLRCIGFSQRYFNNESPFWRYFSDASYWVYLIHLPIQFQILIWVGSEPWHWTLKIAVDVLGSLARHVPTYHFLVRPTWIGWLLNGRTYPIGQAIKLGGIPASTGQMQEETTTAS